MKKRKPRVGIALDSGGAMGGAHVGVFEVLSENGIYPDVIVGSSAGAAVGAFYAAGKLDVFRELITDLSFIESLSYYADPVFPISGLLAGRRARKFIQGIVGDVRIEDLPVTFAAVTTDLLTGETVPITSGPLTDAVLASISMPGIFRPVVHRGRLLADGGISDPLPLDVLRTYAPDITIACNLHVRIPVRFSLAKRRSIVRQEKVTQEQEEDLADSAMERLSRTLGAQKLIEMLKPLTDDLLKKISVSSPVTNGEAAIYRTLKEYIVLRQEKLYEFIRKNLPSKPDGTSLNIFEILSSSTNIQQYQKNRLMLKYEPPDVLIEPDVMDIGPLEFTKGAETIEKGRLKTQEAVPRIKELLKGDST
jgi:NTE family protein